MSKTDEYNPLDYDNLTKNCVEELMRRGPYPLHLQESFIGAGVYALFYKGKFDLYAPIRSPDAQWPIYVGKAVPTGARKGTKSTGPSKSLEKRIGEHCDSIAAATNLEVDDFMCRYLVVTPLWITMAERFLIENFQPVWNVCIEGFGAHNPGKGRHAGEVPWWDVLHPGRAWAKNLVVKRTEKAARERGKEFLATHRPGKLLPPLQKDAEEFSEDSDDE